MEPIPEIVFMVGFAFSVLPAVELVCCLLPVAQPPTRSVAPKTTKAVVLKIFVTLSFCNIFEPPFVNSSLSCAFRITAAFRFMESSPVQSLAFTLIMWLFVRRFAMLFRFLRRLKALASRVFQGLLGSARSVPKICALLGRKRFTCREKNVPFAVWTPVTDIEPLAFKRVARRHREASLLLEKVRRGPGVPGRTG